MDREIFNKRIVIYGTGNTGKAFYEKYKNIKYIYACTSSDEGFCPLDSLKAVQYEDIDKEKDLLVICSVYYEEIRRKLLIDGFEPYKHFIKWDIYEKLLDHFENESRLMISVGQCEIFEMVTVLSRLRNFAQKYSILYFDERKVCSHGDKFSLEEFYDCQKILCLADIFICPTVFSQQSEEGFEILQRQLKSSCKTIKISIFDFDGYWAQDISKCRSLSKFYVAKPNIKVAAYTERDQCIEKMVEEDLSADEILRKIKDVNFFDGDMVKNNCTRSIKRAKLNDRVSDIKISDYLGNTYYKKRLYCDRGHFNENMLREYVRRILIYFNETDEIDLVDTIYVEDLYTHVNELPVYPSTARWLGLEWADENTRYRMIRDGRSENVTFEEYMENLIKYYIKAKDLLKLC